MQKESLLFFSFPSVSNFGRKIMVQIGTAYTVISPANGVLMSVRTLSDE